MLKRTAKKYLISHKGNNYVPKILSDGAVFAISIFIFFLLASPVLIRNFSINPRIIAAVLPGVLADLANADRRDLDLGQLKVNPILAEAARLKAEDMAKGGYFAHDSPDGRTPWYWFNEAGYKFTHAGENLAINFADSEEVERAWMESSGHRANILNKNFTEVGIATAKGMYDGRESIFVVELFGRPASSDVVVVPVSVPSAVNKVPAPKVEVVETDDMFIAVKNAEIVQDANPTPVLRESNFVAKNLTSPSSVASYIYLLLGALVLIAFGSLMLVEYEKRHPRHAVYAGALIFFLATSFYLNQIYYFSKIVIL